MDFFESLLAQFGLFLLVFARINGMFVTVPFFGNRGIPASVKIGFSFLLSLSVLPWVGYAGRGFPDNLISYTLALANELMLGLAIGFVATLVFLAIQLAGELIDMQMGFSMVNVIDPQFGIQVPIIGNFMYILALLILLLTNGHHLLLWGIFRSFELAPVGGFQYSGLSTQVVLDSFVGLFAISLSISAPVVGVLLLTSAALGIVSCTIPQMNVFLVGMPLTILVGLTILPLMLPLYGILLGDLFSRMVGLIIAFLNTLVT